MSPGARSEGRCCLAASLTIQYQSSLNGCDTHPMRQVTVVNKGTNNCAALGLGLTTSLKYEGWSTRPHTRFPKAMSSTRALPER